MNVLLIKHPTVFALVAAMMALVVLSISFLFMEPRVALSQGSINSNEFEVTATIAGEISFEIQPSAVNLLPAIPGVTGGTASGSTPFSVLSNNASGYTVAIAFQSATAMQYDQGAGSIPNAGGTTISNFVSGSTTANTASFGYSASGTAVTTEFRGTASTCGTGSATGLFCYKLDADATVADVFVDTSGPSAPAGDPYEVFFRVVVEENPSPVLSTGTYTATATLTATEKV